ncbi:uncharacterized protein BDR25DRAFT_342882 [Lindgomyces ingoldianus]|uniref:Uncharacterized protein n=1 Tax=Lindgomyces ingoldianus TaxID=673940 RepID=A0ACB6QUL6_9PLEO|nr:uncharacterized protein BDR25DRAFT_342882 [Lindgomyces ingoldianus]KAF2470552.1 hypothetical protein BDR25DRAFT_342882 [Lindgomyces ingoldianus]
MKAESLSKVYRLFGDLHDYKHAPMSSLVGALMEVGAIITPVGLHSPIPKGVIRYSSHNSVVGSRHYDMVIANSLIASSQQPSFLARGKSLTAKERRDSALVENGPKVLDPPSRSSTFQNSGADIEVLVQDNEGEKVTYQQQTRILVAAVLASFCVIGNGGILALFAIVYYPFIPLIGRHITWVCCFGTTIVTLGLLTASASTNRSSQSTLANVAGSYKVLAQQASLGDCQFFRQANAQLAGGLGGAVLLGAASIIAPPARKYERHSFRIVPLKTFRDPIFTMLMAVNFLNPLTVATCLVFGRISANLWAEAAPRPRCC